MAPALDPAVAAEMRARAQAVRERQSAGNFTKSWSLSGKQAVVEPGKGVVIRLLPRWDFATSMVSGPGGTRVPNPAYKPGRAYVEAFEHWWDAEAGRRTREFCPQTTNPEAECAICVSSQAMLQSASKEDRDFGKGLRANQVFIFNAVVDDPRRLGDDKLADIRIISTSGTMFNCISDIMTGGDKEQFARGDVTDPRAGYDLVFNRPAKGGGERWSVGVAPNQSPLYGPAQSAAFKGWAARLLDLDDMLAKETKDSAGIFKAYYGRDPKPGELGEVPLRTNKRATPIEEEPEAIADQQESAGEPEGPDDEYMMPPSQPRGPAAGPKNTPPAPPKRAPRR